MQPARNDPCVCGSGKKFKKCCGNKAAAERVDAAAFLREARRVYDMGDPERALVLVSKVLEQLPSNAEAAQVAGVIHLQAGRPDAALPYLEKAARLKPKDPLVQQGLAACLYALGRFDEAEQRCRRALALNPAFADAHNDLGRILTALGRPDEAVESYRLAIQLSRDNALFQYNLGSLLQAMPGQLREAEDCYREALRSDPEFVPALSNLGALCLQQKKPEDARTYLLSAHRLSPQDPRIMAHLAGAFLQLKDYRSAAEWSRRATEMGHNAAYSQLGIAMEQSGDVDGAIEAYRKLAMSEPESAASKNYIRALLVAGKVEEAYAWFMQVDSDGADPVLLPEMVSVFQSMCDFRRLAEIRPRFLDALQSLSRSNTPALETSLLLLNYDDSITEDRVFEYHALWGSLASSAGDPNAAHRHRPLPVAREKLRVGYISPDFRRHSVSHFIRTIVKEHDRARFEVVCYSNVRRPDDVTDFFRQSADRYVDVTALNDSELADRIARDEIDILIDLSGHTADTRVGALSSRPAAVQMTYLGYANTSGARFMDYWISDVHAHSDSTEHRTERLLRLPECYLCFGAFEERKINELPPSHSNGYVTFGSFNNLAKISWRTMRLWSAILHRVPDARLLIKGRWAHSAYTQKNLLEGFGELGVPADRVSFSGFVDASNEHLDRYNDIDIALDTTPYNGTTTTCEALWMGVPVVTLAGERHRERTSLTILQNAGVSETIAWSEQEYVDIATRLAQDPSALTSLRRRAATGIRASILCDPKRFTRQYEAALMSAWEARELRA